MTNKERYPGNPILAEHEEQLRLAKEAKEQGDTSGSTTKIVNGVDLDSFVPGAVDPATGMPLCPECGTLLGENCSSCFHTRFADGSPLPDWQKKIK